jgi:hypothetical protein
MLGDHRDRSIIQRGIERGSGLPGYASPRSGPAIAALAHPGPSEDGHAGLGSLPACASARSTDCSVLGSDLLTPRSRVALKTPVAQVSEPAMHTSSIHPIAAGAGSRNTVRIVS